MELRQWLFLAGILIILLVIFDALRRAHRARLDAAEMAREMGADDLKQSPLEDNCNGELPNGSYRVTQPAHAGWSDGVARFTPASPGTDDPAGTSDAGLSPRGFASERSAQPGEEEGLVADPDDHSTTTRKPLLDEEFKKRFLKPFSRPDASESPASASRPVTAPSSAPRESAPPSGSGHPVAPRPLTAPTTRPAGSPRRQEEEGLIIAINVISKEDDSFPGAVLRKLVEACGMELGPMKIYHRHEYGFGEGPVQFSMANAIEPGIFSPGFEGDDIPGVCFFMKLPGPDDSRQAFEFMLETARCFVANLGGELRDEQQSALTTQTIEHYRNRVREFERRRLSEKA